MRQLLIATAALFLIENDTLAQNADNGKRISERSCASCHAIDLPPVGKQARIVSFTAIAEKPAMNIDIITSFLLRPHVTMPGLPLDRDQAQDVASFIMSLKK
jgi:mono/diheme cytochrome c family protein